jgi:hypothetical protein
MKTVYFIILLWGLLPVIPAWGHSGDLDSKGGHTCITNCEKYGLSHGEYHYHRRPEPVISPEPEENGPVISSLSGDLQESNIQTPVKKADADLRKVILYLLCFWFLIRLYQRISGKPVTVGRLFKGLFS